MSDHDWFTRFDRSVCEGTHPEVDGVCPEKQKGDVKLLGDLLGGTVLGDLLGMDEVDTCGVCGCSLVGLDATNTPPSKCIRRETHRDR